MSSLKQDIEILKNGGIIAYPTEAIYGIGCDPFNEAAVKKVYDLKQRPMEKGLIIIASEFSQLEDLIVPTEHMDTVLKSWPGPNTWVFPVTDKVPKILTGSFDALAVRVTAHPICKALCEAFGKAIVSTSANISTEPPVKTWQELDPKLTANIDSIVKDEVGARENCSTIRDARTLAVIRG